MKMRGEVAPTASSSVGINLSVEGESQCSTSASRILPQIAPRAPDRNPQLGLSSRWQYAFAGDPRTRQHRLAHSGGRGHSRIMPLMTGLSDFHLGAEVVASDGR